MEAQLADAHHATTDSTLSSVVDSGYSFTGKTTIVLSNANIQITNNGSTVTKAYPPGGVIYVANGTCGQSYKVLDPYGDTNAIPTGCADVYVSGSYVNQELTIASQKDIIVNGDISRGSGGDGMLGLIADNFVRVYHKINRDSSDPTNCTNATYTVIHEIDAAILALSHSFTVDNYYCGSQLGTLTVNGAIAQKFRGPVGTTGSGGSGYLKDYIYDKRFQFGCRRTSSARSRRRGASSATPSRCTPASAGPGRLIPRPRARGRGITRPGA